MKCSVACSHACGNAIARGRCRLCEYAIHNVCDLDCRCMHIQCYLSTSWRSCSQWRKHDCKIILNGATVVYIVTAIHKLTMNFTKIDKKLKSPVVPLQQRVSAKWRCPFEWWCNHCLNSRLQLASCYLSLSVFKSPSQSEKSWFSERGSDHAQLWR